MYLCKANAKVVKFTILQKLKRTFFDIMKEFTNISTLIFDFGDVLIKLNLNRCIQNIKNLGVKDVEKYLSNFGQSDFFMKFEVGVIGIQEFREEIRKLTTLEVSDQEIDAAWCSFLDVIPQEKLDLLVELRKKYKILLLSNTNPLHIEQNAAIEFGRRGKTIYDYFDACYLSYQMKLAKPDKNIFLAVLADAQLKAEECLFLDDGIKNIETANSLGFQTYHVDPEENLDFLLTAIH